VLKDDFYAIITKDFQPGSIKASIKLNRYHHIFEGHFPGNPVMPGVCMVQLVKEFMEDAWSVPLRITASSSIKFLSVIDPGKEIQINLTVDYSTERDGYAVQASLFWEQNIYFKFKGTLEAI